MNIYELLGFAMGDGHIFYNKKCRKYKLELDGNVEEDMDYFLKIKEFLVKNTDSKPRLFIVNQKKGRTLRLEVYNKKFVENLISMGLPAGKKTFIIQLPASLGKDKTLYLVRGLFEADGCLYFSKSKKGKYPSYPRIEIKTSSEKLLEQLKNFLISQGFSPYIRRCKSDRTPAIGISGEAPLEKWRELIGFVSLKNKTKYNFWKTKGFYIPHTPLKNRMIYAHVA